MGMKKCQQCGAMHPSAKRACPCGYQFEIKSKLRSPPCDGQYPPAPPVSHMLLQQQIHMAQQLLANGACDASTPTQQLLSPALHPASPQLTTQQASDDAGGADEGEMCGSGEEMDEDCMGGDSTVDSYMKMFNGEDAEDSPPPRPADTVTVLQEEPHQPPSTDSIHTPTATLSPSSGGGGGGGFFSAAGGVRKRGRPAGWRKHLHSSAATDIDCSPSMVPRPSNMSTIMSVRSPAPHKPRGRPRGSGALRNYAPARASAAAAHNYLRMLNAAKLGHGPMPSPEQDSNVVGAAVVKTEDSPPGQQQQQSASQLAAKLVERGCCLCINVGGQLFHTTAETLCKHPDSRLYSWLFGPVPIPFDEARQCYFVDRDGSVFQHVLNFVRTGRLTLPDDFCAWEQLREDAVHYNLPGLVDALDHRQRPRGSTYVLLEWEPEPAADPLLLVSGPRDVIVQAFPEMEVPNGGHVERLSLKTQLPQLTLSEAVHNITGVAPLGGRGGGGGRRLALTHTCSANTHSIKYHFMS